MPKTGRVLVVCALILDEEGRVLVVERPLDKPCGGYLEFPGGKVEPNEDVLEGLKRELKEELGYEAATPFFPLTFFVVPLLDKEHVVLGYYTKIKEPFKPQLLEGQRSYQWATFEELEMLPVVPQNKAILPFLKNTLYGASP